MLATLDAAHCNKETAKFIGGKAGMGLPHHCQDRQADALPEGS